MRPVKLICLISLIILVPIPLTLQAKTTAEVIQNAANYLQTKPVNDWSIMAFQTADININTADYFNTSPGKTALDYARRILAVTSTKQDPRTLSSINYIDLLKATFANGQLGQTNLLNDDIFGILALISAGENPNAEMLISLKTHLLSQQKPTGGWESGNGWGEDSNTTAAAVMALYELGLKDSEPAIQQALNYLQNLQQDDAGFYYNDGEWTTQSDASSSSWILSMLYKLNINPLSSDWTKIQIIEADEEEERQEAIISVIDYLTNKQEEAGYFYSPWGETAFTPIETAYAVIALSGYGYPINTITLAPPQSPQLNPPAGNYNQTQEITLTADEQTQIFYTLNGDEPNSNSELYEEPITIEETTIIKAIAYNNAGWTSEIVEAHYEIQRIGGSMPIALIPPVNQPIIKTNPSQPAIISPPVEPDLKAEEEAEKIEEEEEEETKEEEVSPLLNNEIEQEEDKESAKALESALPPIYPNGSLLKSQNAEIIYYIQNNQKYPVKQKINSKILTVDSTVLYTYATASAIEQLPQTPNRIIQASTGDIYLIKENKKYKFKNLNAFFDWGYSFNDIEGVDDALLSKFEEGEGI